MSEKNRTRIIFRNSLSGPNGAAIRLGLNRSTLQFYMKKLGISRLRWGTFAERVQRDFSSGVRSGVNGTPTFFINSQRHDGDFELETLLQTIQKMIPATK